MEINLPPVLAEVTAAFERHERALVGIHVAAHVSFRARQAVSRARSAARGCVVGSLQRGHGRRSGDQCAASRHRSPSPCASPPPDLPVQPSIVSPLAGLACALAVACAHGQQLEPRAYSNVPVGINFAVAGFSHSSGDVLPDPSIPARDAAAKVNGLFAAYSRSLDLWGRSSLVTVVAPWASGTVSGVLEGRGASVDREGFGDPSLKLSMNFLGAPALTLKEFAGYRQTTIVGGSLQVTAPLGSYDPARIVNVGANRWTLRPELGVSRALGNWVLEGALAVSLFTDNHEFQVNRTRGQEPLYSAQAHLVYNFRPGLWGAVNYTFYAGGRSSVDGVARDDRLQSSRWGLTLTLPLDPRNSVKLFASTGVLARTGTDFDMAGIAFQHRWGGGL